MTEESYPTSRFQKLQIQHDSRVRLPSCRAFLHWDASFKSCYLTGSQKQPESLTSQEENTTDDVKSTRVNPFRDSPPDLGDDLPILDSSFMAAGLLSFTFNCLSFLLYVSNLAFSYYNFSPWNMKTHGPRNCSLASIDYQCRYHVCRLPTITLTNTNHVPQWQKPR